MDLLAKILRMRGLSMRTVERAAGMGENSMARLLQGKKNAYLSHVFRVLAALDIAPGDFFELAYPRNPLRSPAELLDPRLLEVANGKSLEERTQELVEVQARLQAYANAAGITLPEAGGPPAPAAEPAPEPQAENTR